MSIAGSAVRSTRCSILRVCVDSDQNRELSGRVLSPLLGEERFSSILMLMSEMEDFFDRIQFPQRSFEIRTFDRHKRQGTPADAGEKGLSMSSETVDPKVVSQMEAAAGEKATFVIHVRFRQNATWQGSVQWVEGRKEQHFRSTLELIKMMEDAVSQNTEPTATGSWTDGPSHGDKPE